jgi:DNA-binding MarR family transcriptional regulator
LVQRRISQTDQRRREVVLSKRGESVLRSAWPVMATGYARLAAGIDSEALATTARTLVQMIENMRSVADP